jgi:colanic acid/amylovoran biosynthesis protein
MMRAAVEALTDQGWHCAAMSTCQGLPSYRYDDSGVARQFFAGLDVEIDDSFHTPSDLLAALAGCQLVVTTRMHLAILALVARVPVVAVAYEFKTVELFRSLGLGHAVVPIEGSSPDWMRRALAQAIDAPDRFRLGVEDLERLRDAAAGPADLVTALAQRSHGEPS